MWYSIFITCCDSCCHQIESDLNYYLVKLWFLFYCLSECYLNAYLVRICLYLVDIVLPNKSIKKKQSIIVSRSQEALPVVGLPKHLTCLPEVPDRSSTCSVGIYGISWFEVLFWKVHNSNHVYFYGEQLICLFHGDNHWEKKSSIRQMAKYHIRSAYKNNYRSLREI